MFQGAAALSLDGKGRLAIPARHRTALTALSEDLILTAHPHRCLLIYPEPAWAPIRDKVLSGSSLEHQSALLRRLFVGFAMEERVDAAGRILVAPELREFAEMDKRVWLVGQGDHFELWSEANWKKQQEAIFALGDKLLPPGFESLPL